MSLILAPDDIDFDHYMRDTESQHKVKRLSDWDDDLIEEFNSTPDAETHPKLPWRRLETRISLRPGEMSLWFGYSGHGKSLLLGQAMLGVVAQGSSCCIASFEMRPRKTLARMCRQLVDAFQPSPVQVREFTGWAGRKAWVYDQTGSVDPQRVYAVIRYSAEVLKVQHFVVDNLTKCVAADDDYAGQKAIVDKLTELARDLGIHIHLVHHARKDRDETRPPRKMDALGASAITNLADNVFIVWRNKAKWEAETVDTKLPDAQFICDKQRHGTGWEGSLNLTFHQRSMQYIEYGSNAIDMRCYPHEAGLRGVA
jgi:twinkle protein